MTCSHTKVEFVATTNSGIAFDQDDLITEYEKITTYTYRDLDVNTYECYMCGKVFTYSKVSTVNKEDV